MMKTLTQAQLADCKREGYLHLKGVIPREVLDWSQQVLAGQY